MTSEKIGDNDAGDYKVLYNHTLPHASVKFTQHCIGGVIWIESTGHYPICPTELQNIIDGYTEKEE